MSKKDPVLLLLACACAFMGDAAAGGRDVAALARPEGFINTLPPIQPPAGPLPLDSTVTV